jgi:protein-S-isoprenylcysteine O-methyltransferase Ste14
MTRSAFLRNVPLPPDIAMSETLTSPGVRFPPPFLFVAGFLAGLGLNALLPFPLVPGGATPLSVFVGWGLVALALLLGAWAMFTFAGARTSILPHKPAAGVVEAGPYRYSRNPMYVALGLLYLGLALWLNVLWPVFLLPVVYVLLWSLVVEREERYLEEAFGETYVAYRSRVRRWL